MLIGEHNQVEMEACALIVKKRGINGWPGVA